MQHIIFVEVIKYQFLSRWRLYSGRFKAINAHALYDNSDFSSSRLILLHYKFTYTTVQLYMISLFSIIEFSTSPPTWLRDEDVWYKLGFPDELRDDAMKRGATSIKTGTLCPVLPTRPHWRTLCCCRQCESIGLKFNACACVFWFRVSLALQTVIHEAYANATAWLPLNIARLWSGYTICGSLT